MDSPEAQQSYLHWIFTSLGFGYTVILLLVAAFSFLLTLIIVLRGKGPMAAAALVLGVHAPLLIGALAAVQGAIASFRVIAMSGATPKASEVAEGVSVTLVAMMIALLLMAPSYVVAVLGAFVRSLVSPAEGQHR